MRHASITTTMNISGRAMTDSKRQANGNVALKGGRVTEEKADAFPINPEVLANVV
jgi:hypothetical protein